MANEPRRFNKGIVLRNLSDGPNPTDTNPTCNIPGHEWVIDTNTTQTAVVTCIANACDLFTLATHGLCTGQHVKVTTVAAGITTCPANLLDLNDKAFVVSATACTFKLSATKGGSAIAITNCAGSVTLTVIEEQIQAHLCVGTEKIVTDSNTITMTNKILCSPTLNCVTFGGTNTFGDDELFIVDTTDNTKKLQYDITGTTCITGTLQTAFTTAKTVTLPDATDTLVGKATTDTLTNKTLGDTNTINAQDDAFTIDCAACATKQIDFAAGGTACTKTTVSAAQTANRTVTLPDATDTLVGKATTDTLTNKTLGDTNTINAQDDAFTIDCAGDATKQIDFAAGGTACTKTTISAAQTANRTITLPDAADTLVGKATTDTLTNKTIDGDCNTLQCIAITSLKTEAGCTCVFVSRNCAGVIIDTKAVPAGVVVGTTDTQTLTNKVITIDDDNFTLQDNLCASKKAQFQASSITACTTRTFTFPDVTGVLGIDPTTTTGDVIFRNACGDLARLAAGCNTEVLTLAGGIPSWAAPAAASPCITTKTANYTILASDDILLGNAACGGFTFTLPTAACNDGKIFYIKKIESSNNIITIDANGCQTIDGNLTRKLATDNETIILASDGANWEILNRYSCTTWVDDGAVTITATTTNPTKGTMATDKLFWRRVGENMEIRMEIKQTGIGTSGSGDYLYAIPSCYTIDTSKITAYAVVEGADAFKSNNLAGFSNASNAAANNANLGVIVFNTTTVRFIGISSDDASGNSLGAISSGFFALGSNASNEYYAEFSVPITNWES